MKCLHSVSGLRRGTVQPHAKSNLMVSRETSAKSRSSCHWIQSTALSRVVIEGSPGAVIQWSRPPNAGRGQSSRSCIHVSREATSSPKRLRERGCSFPCPDVGRLSTLAPHLEAAA